ncbi:putative monooxygenase, partial [Bordetella avium 197N]
VIQEIAKIRVKPGHEAAFEAAVQTALPLFARAKGCHGAALHRGIESPQDYALVVQWETLENHMVDFRNSADFQEWRKLVGDHFAAPPQVHHETKVI